jgi:hypothetical protein
MKTSPVQGVRSNRRYPISMACAMAFRKNSSFIDTFGLCFLT